MTPASRLALKTQHLWPLSALVFLGALGALIPINQVDFWWHLALGRDITVLSTIPTTSSHSWILAPQTPFIYGSWLAEWMLYQLYTLGGLPLIVLVRNALLLLGYGLVGVEARRRSGSWRLAALAITGAGLMALNNLSVRPQIFAWPLITSTALLLGAFRADQLRARWLLLVPVLMIGWVNLHGSFAIGLGLIGVTCGGETLTLLWRWRQMDRATRRLRLVRNSRLIGIAALSVLATLCNPRGSGIITFVSGLVGHPAAQQFGGEWQPPDLLAFPGLLLPLAVVLAALGWARQPRRFDLTDLALLCAFALLGVSSIRNLIWFGMIGWPIAVGALRSRHTLTAQQFVRYPLLNYGLAGSLCVPLLIVQPPLKAALDLPPALAGLGSSLPDGVYLDERTPVRAVAWLQAHPLPVNARLFHDMTYGSYLIWALPDVKVYVDGRIELYPYEEWLRYRRIANNENARAELRTLGATHALLSRDGQAELIADLSQPNSGWTQRYADDQAVIFENTALRTTP